MERKLADIISADDADRAVETLRELLEAEKKMRIRGKDGCENVLVPDGMVRLLAAKTILEFKFGRARQQIDVSSKVSHVHASIDELIERAKQVERVERTTEIVSGYIQSPQTGIVIEDPSQEEVVEVDG